MTCSCLPRMIWMQGWVKPAGVKPLGSSLLLWLMQEWYAELTAYNKPSWQRWKGYSKRSGEIGSSYIFNKGWVTFCNVWNYSLLKVWCGNTNISIPFANAAYDCTLQILRCYGTEANSISVNKKGLWGLCRLEYMSNWI